MCSLAEISARDGTLKQKLRWSLLFLQPSRKSRRVSVSNKCTQSRSTTPSVTTGWEQTGVRNLFVLSHNILNSLSSEPSRDMALRKADKFSEHTASESLKYAECQEWEELILKDTIQFPASIMLLGNTGGWKL